MTAQIVRSITFAAALGLLAGGAVARTAAAHDLPASAVLGYSAAPLNGQGYTDRPQRDRAVRGVTPAPNEPETTGSIRRRPAAERSR